MTPLPPSPSEGSSLPPRHRPSLDSFNQDTTELDLWAFDDADDLVDAAEASQPVVLVPRAFGKNLPAPREISSDPSADAENREDSRPAAREDSIRMNVNKAHTKSRPASSLLRTTTPEGEFDDLEAWGSPEGQAELAPPPAVVVPAAPQPASPPQPAAVAPPPSAAAPPPAPEPHTPAPAPQAAEVDEFSPVVPAHAVPVSLRPHLRLSPIERICLIGLLVVLIAGAGAILVFSLNRLPTEAQRAKANDFPIKGEHLTIVSAKSYWRAPVVTGPTPDTVRRGTQLLPVLELAVSGGPAAIRVLFRNEDRGVVGDAVTRTVSSAGTLKIPATAGFDDLGMHAAYRTGESKPWTIEVLEAPTEDTTGRQFKPLFEINISTDRH